MNLTEFPEIREEVNEALSELRNKINLAFWVGITLGGVSGSIIMLVIMALAELRVAHE